MEPMEEFEFKPLTEGLGFHGRSKKISPPLPRKGAPPEPEITPSPSSSTVDEILKTLHSQKPYGFDESKEILKGLKTETPLRLGPSVIQFSAATLDGMLVVSMYLCCLILLLVVTKVDLFANLVTPDSEKMIYVSLLALFGILSWIYLVTCRIFLGFTAGEWVFDQHMGLPQNVGSADYSLRVALRSFVIVATGFIPLPFFSKMLGRDLLGQLLGPELYKKV